MLSPRLFRKHEYVVIAFFTYTAVLSTILPVPANITRVTITMNAVVIGGLALMAHALTQTRSDVLEVLRDWYPASLLLLAYREMGWFAPRAHTYAFEKVWVAWDRVLLYDVGLKRLIESTGPVAPSLLEISYSLVYTMAPLSITMLYVYRHRERMSSLLLTLLLGVLLSYMFFPLFPSEPPRTAFPGQDLPATLTIFRRFNLALLGGYGIHTSVFPSAHVSGSFSAAFAIRRTLPKHRWTWYYMVTLATLIAISTVYGRYHYAADAVAGFGVAIAAVGISRIVEGRAKPGV